MPQEKRGGEKGKPPLRGKDSSTTRDQKQPKEFRINTHKGMKRQS